MLDLKWTVAHSFSEVENDWRDLEKRALITPFQQFDWHKTVTLSANTERAFVVVRDKSNVQAIFPLMIRKSFGVRVLQWHGDDWTDYFLPVIEKNLFRTLAPNDVDAIWKRLRSLTGDPSATLLYRQPAQVSGAPNPFAQWSAHSEGMPAFALNLGTDWETFYTAMHSGGTRRGLKEKRRRLDGEGNIEFVRFTEPQALRENLHRIFKWKSDQLDARGANNPFVDPQERDLIVSRMLAGGEVWHLYGIQRDGHTIALNLTLAGPVSWLLYQMAHEEGPHTKHSPGRLLLNHVLEQATIAGTPLFDFSRGEVGVKKEICDVELDLIRTIKAHSPAGVPFAAFEAAKLHAKRTIKQSPKLLDLAFQANRARKKLFTKSSEAFGVTTETSTKAL
ncbi:GNAT family N-acetyltransferase [Flaviflagellibacter deserti]|uniref:GNAT family N-acetyltransferase n=1 Tax=Flaviflagellibacter deserti TaxID=2267266 RepID=A0ABV9Z4W6_9HYPH